MSLLQDKKKFLPLSISGGLLLISLVVSIAVFTGNDRKWHPYVMYFPRYSDPKQINGEIRKIRLRDEVSENVENFARELILGPADLRYLRIFPEETKINTILLRDSVLFVDFSHDLLFSGESNPLSLAEGLELFTRSVRWNFPDIGEIVYTINGEVPFDFIDGFADN